MTGAGTTLPQLGDAVFLTDTGLETTLIFHDGLDLPHFSVLRLLDDEAGRERVHRYFVEHAEVAARAGTGFVLESPTWRGSADWGALLGYISDELAEANRVAVGRLADLRSELESAGVTTVVSGCVGPRGDGYDGAALMDPALAASYHAEQVRAFADGGADMVHAMTLTYPDEAIGVVEAAGRAGLPVAISFTVETDGTLPDGTPLAAAVDRVDEATGGAAAYFGVNCAHPSHFADLLDPGAHSTQRLRSLRANASRMSHAELDESETLDDGDPETLGREYADLRARLPHLSVLGGCCGTDLRHLEAIAATLPRASSGFGPARAASYPRKSPFPPLPARSHRAVRRNRHDRTE